MPHPFPIRTGPHRITGRITGRIAAMAASLLVLVLVAGCGLLSSGAASQPTLKPKPVPATGAAAPPPSSGLATYYHQKLSWHPCQNHELCSRLRVPLDYANPSGRSISLSVLKVPATDHKDKVGSLVVNPGGPGASGVNYAANATTNFGDNLRRSFDIVGFDPRGVGDSTPIHCESGHQLDAFVAADPDPKTPAEIHRSDTLLRQLGQGCLQHSGGVARHMSTVEAAKDIDILRAALGDSRLSYFGASYGTYLGATYAGLFPKRVGRMVLDGAINPALSNLQLNLAQAHGFEVALDSYVRHCAQSGSCYLGSSVAEGTAKIRRFLDQVDAHPLPGSGGRQLTEGTAVLGIWAPLYNRNYWPILDTALKAAFSGDGAQLLSLADAYTSRGPNGYADNSLQALYAVNCLDHPDSIPTSKVARYIPQFEKASPTFGSIFAFGLSSCSTWPVHTHHASGPIHAPGAPPIMVVGTTRDPATPLAWAQALVHQLDSAVLVRRNGDGHTGYHTGNACVDHAVESYLVSGVVPKHQVNC